jgi:GcrA cell cycle regulator
MSQCWTDERVELLKKLWVEGLSAAQIANRLGGVTRNAVIGKVHRLGLAGRNAPSQPTRRMPSQPIVRATVAAPARPAAPKPMAAASIASSAPATHIPPVSVVRPVAAPVMAQAAVSASPRRPQRSATGLVDVHGLGHNMCKWPIGDPGDPDFGFCGSRCESGAVYCTEHAAVAYTQPINLRRERADDKAAADLRRLQRSASI